MATLNKTILLGNLTREIELRYTPTNKAVATIGLAVNRNYNKGDEKLQETCFINCVAWGQLATICAEYLSKGSPVLVEGRLQSRQWEDKNGKKNTIIEVVAENVQFLGRKEDKPSREEEPEPVPEDDIIVPGEQELF